MNVDKKTMPVGTPVIVRKDNGLHLRTHTRSAPWLLGGHSWVVQVEGIAGCYSLDRIEVTVEPRPEEKLVTVCAACFRASCWQGEFLCDDYKTADITHKTIKELAKLDRESPHYWKSDEELNPTFEGRVRA